MTLVIELELSQAQLLVVVLSDSCTLVLLDLAGLQVRHHLVILGDDPTLAFDQLIHGCLTDLVDRAPGRLKISQALAFKILVH